MNKLVTAALCGSLALCGAQAFASSSSTGAAASDESHSTATRQKLMTECMSHEAKSNTEATEACRTQVDSELMDIKNAGTGQGQQKPR